MIDVTRKHSLAESEARPRAERLLTEIRTRLGLFGLVGRWEGDTLVLRAPSGTAQGTSGEIVVGEDSVRIVLHLTPQLRAMQSTIESGLADVVRRCFS